MNKIQIVHYINQFFGQIGGEEKADIAPRVEDGPVGPGNAFDNALSEHGEIVKTITCGAVAEIANGELGLPVV